MTLSAGGKGVKIMTHCQPDGKGLNDSLSAGGKGVKIIGVEYSLKNGGERNEPMRRRAASMTAAPLSMVAMRMS